MSLFLFVCGTRVIAFTRVNVVWLLSYTVMAFDRLFRSLSGRFLLLLRWRVSILCDRSK